MLNYLDKTVVDELKLIMEGDLSMLYEAYLDDAAKRLDELDLSVKKEDCDHTRRIAHTLKGSSRNVGACHFADLCAALELAAREEDIAPWASLVEQMKPSFLTTKSEIELEVLGV